MNEHDSKETKLKSDKTGKKARRPIRHVVPFRKWRGGNERSSAKKELMEIFIATDVYGERELSHFSFILAIGFLFIGLCGCFSHLFFDVFHFEELASLTESFNPLWVYVICAVIGAAAVLYSIPDAKSETHSGPHYRGDRLTTEIRAEDRSKPFYDKVDAIAKDIMKKRITALYSKAYIAIDNVFYLKWDAFGDRKWELMNNQIQDIMDALTYHRAPNMPSAQEIERALETGEYFDETRAQLRSAVEVIEDVCDIWSGVGGLDGCRVLLSERTVMYDPGDDLGKLGKKLGMEMKMEAYFEKGIPAQALR